MNKFICKCCGNEKTVLRPRGFSWVLGLVGLIIFVPLVLVGFAWSKTLIPHCSVCGSKRLKKIKMEEQNV